MNAMNEDEDDFADDLTYDEQEYLKGIIERIQSGEEQLTRMIIPKFGEIFRLGSKAIIKDKHGFDSDSDRYSRNVITIWPTPLIARKHTSFFHDVRVVKQLSRYWWLVSISKDSDKRDNRDE